MTSNVGADTIKRGVQLGFGLPVDEKADEKQHYDDMRKNVIEQLRRAFRPEFLNRVDAMIVFSALSKDEIKQIVDLEIKKVGERLIEHAITLEMTEAARNWLADHGYDPEYGARPLRRLIQNEVEDRLSDGILSGEFPLASIVHVDVENDQLVMKRLEEDSLETPTGGTD